MRNIYLGSLVSSRLRLKPFCPPPKQAHPSSPGKHIRNESFKSLINTRQRAKLQAFLLPLKELASSSSSASPTQQNAIQPQQKPQPAYSVMLLKLRLLHVIILLSYNKKVTLFRPSADKNAITLIVLTTGLKFLMLLDILVIIFESEPSLTV